MKKFLILLVSLLFMGLYAHASLDSTLDKINNVLNKIDRTEYTINRAKKRIPTIPQTTGYPNTQTTTSPTYQQTNTNPYGGGNPYQYSNTNTYGGNQYQYQNQNTDYGNMPTQVQTQEPVDPTIQKGQQYSQDRVFRGQASTLGELPAGAIVMDPKSVWNYRRGSAYDGDIIVSYPVFWRKMEDNHYTDGATLLLSEVSVATYPFCYLRKGLRAWDESDARRFLRTSFYNHLSDGFKNAIVNVNIPFADMSGNPKTINDNFFLLSIVELGLSDRANNGSVIKYYDLPKHYESLTFNYTASNNTYWFLSSKIDFTRTINKPEAKSAGYISEVFYVANGVLGASASRASRNIRPAINLKSSTKISGPYEFKHGNSGEKLIYYTLEF